jgi:hypothetical protein
MHSMTGAKAPRVVVPPRSKETGIPNIPYSFLKLDGRSSGFCAKQIAGDGWSMIGPAFLVGGDR